MNRLHWMVLPLGLLCGALWAVEKEKDDNDEKPGNKTEGRSEHKRTDDKDGGLIGQAKPGGSARVNGISYHGGPVMLGTTTVYYIFYGNWPAAVTPTDSSTRSILTDFAKNIGGSAYFNINTTYYNGSNQKVSNSVAYGGSIDDNYSQGTVLTDSNVFTIVSNAITSGKFPNNANAVYFVLTSKDVNESSGFCTQYCGWHTYGTVNSTKIKYSFVGDPGRCITSCAYQSVGPNLNAGADGMVSIIAHELEEAVTDPQLNAWYDSRGYENADKCAWTFGTMYTANGAKANMHLGSRDYLIQRNWVNASGGSCALTY